MALCLLIHATLTEYVPGAGTQTKGRRSPRLSTEDIERHQPTSKQREESKLELPGVLWDHRASENPSVEGYYGLGTELEASAVVSHLSL